MMCLIVVKRFCLEFVNGVAEIQKETEPNKDESAN